MGGQCCGLAPQYGNCTWPASNATLLRSCDFSRAGASNGRTMLLPGPAMLLPGPALLLPSSAMLLPCPAALSQAMATLLRRSWSRSQQCEDNAYACPRNAATVLGPGAIFFQFLVHDPALTMVFYPVIGSDHFARSRYSIMLLDPITRSYYSIMLLDRYSIDRSPAAIGSTRRSDPLSTLSI